MLAVGPYDYIDSYQGTFHNASHSINIQTIGKAFFTLAPRWLGALLYIRNQLVKVFGLKISDTKPKNRQALIDAFSCEPNEQLGFFKVYERSANEVILGADDKHLDFRVSLLHETSLKENSAHRLTISTTVKFNNGFGRLYFIPVKPFHQLIVRVMLKNILKKLEQHTLE